MQIIFTATALPGRYFCGDVTGDDDTVLGLWPMIGTCRDIDDDVAGRGEYQLTRIRRTAATASCR